MRTDWLRGACASGLVIAGTALAQTPDITSFSDNGMLTWTNSNTNLFYRIEWAPALTISNAWHSDYSDLLDIRSPNSTVTSAVPMFYRVCGSSNRLVYPAPVPKTGQTTVYQTWDDGSYQKGVALPPPRFTIQDDTNCVTDNLTGLVWARNANMGSDMTWFAAITYCEGLTYGGTNDWRLPNAKELYSLIDLEHSFPELPSGHPFTDVQLGSYWSSSTRADDTSEAWRVYLNDGIVHYAPKTLTSYVWPVRGGH